jgi:ubiquinone biosynthesis protein COQ9
MFDSGTPRDKIIAAALRLAEARGWRELSLGDIAAEAQVPLAELAHEFQCKAQILAAFTAAVDEAVLTKFAAPTADPARDRLFDVILTRFEVMQPYKPALRRIACSLGMSPGAALAQAFPALKSQYWMLNAAGIDGEGARGLFRVKGLLAIYARVFAIWLGDDDPGLAATMAALDKRLRRGEAVVQGMARFREGCEAFARAVCGPREKVEASAEAQMPAPPAAPQQA